MRATIQLILLIACVTAPALAQTKTGTTVGQTLLIEPSARLAAMGNAGVTAFGEAMSGFYNPGSLGYLPGSDAQFTHSTWFEGITFNQAIVALRVAGSNTLGLSLTALDSGEMDVRTVAQPEGTGERFNVQDLIFGAAFAHRFTDRFSAGVQVNYFRQTISSSSLSTVSLNVGVLYRLPFRAYLGASLSNFGTRGSFAGRDLDIPYDPDADVFGDNSAIPGTIQTEDFPLPTLFRVGLGLPVDFGSAGRLNVLLDAAQPSDNTESLNVGAEWTFFDALAVRGGYQNLFQQDSETGLTLGAGLQYGFYGYNVHFDYGWAGHEALGSMQRFTLGFSF